MATSDSDDPFDSLLSLETQYYAEGHALGVADGARAGNLEGRIFGMEKGFERFLEMGRLNGKAGVWSAQVGSTAEEDQGGEGGAEGGRQSAGKEKLRTHITRLVELTDPETISTENSEDAVADFDDRIRDARAKERLVANLLSKDEKRGNGGEGSSMSGSRAAAVRVQRKVGTRKAAVNESNAMGTEIEDFIGLPGAAKPKQR